MSANRYIYYNNMKYSQSLYRITIYFFRIKFKSALFSTFILHNLQQKKIITWLKFYEFD